MELGIHRPGIHRRGSERMLAAPVAGRAAVDELAAVVLGIHRTGSEGIEAILAAVVLAQLDALNHFAALGTAGTGNQSRPGLDAVDEPAAVVLAGLDAVDELAALD